jgi:hypothetical protein
VIGTSKKFTLLLLVLDIAFFFAYVAWDYLTQTFGIPMAVQSNSNMVLGIVIAVFVIGVILLIALTKYLHVRLVNKMVAPGQKSLASYKSLILYSLLAFIALLVLTNVTNLLVKMVNSEILGWTIMIVFGIILLFGMLWIYPVQYAINRTGIFWKSYCKGFDNFKKPTKALSVAGFVIAGILVLMLIYGLTFMLALNNKSATTDPAQFLNKYNMFITTWTIISIVWLYIIFFIARMMLYIQTEAMLEVKASPKVVAKRKPKKK